MTAEGTKMEKLHFSSRKRKYWGFLGTTFHNILFLFLRRIKIYFNCYVEFP